MTAIPRYKEEDYAFISPISEIIEEARNGRMFILVDSEDRENEGDLVIPAQMATPEMINFMITNARGLVCLALTQERAQELELGLMPTHNQSVSHTAFTDSIEAKDGVTTGISAHDRARTIEVAIDSTKNANDITRPGHIFPLAARNGGTLVRAGHTEAIVDIARLANLNPSGIVCEIINGDGTMARLPDLVAFAQRHQLKLATISDLIAYRRQHDSLIRRRSQEAFSSRYGGEFTMNFYESTNDLTYHAALVKGDITDGKPVLTRMHVANIRQDMLGEISPRVDLLRRSMEIIEQEGRGALVLLHPDQSPLFSKLEGGGIQRSHSNLKGERLVEYGAGAQILLDLGVREMILLSDTEFKVPGLEGYGLKIVGWRPVLGQQSK